MSRTGRLSAAAVTVFVIGLALLGIGQSRTERAERVSGFTEAMGGAAVDVGRDPLMYVGGGLLVLAVVLTIGAVVGYATNADG